MKAWSKPGIPAVPGTSGIPRIHDSASGRLVEAGSGHTARLYVCGITPYDATHLGHANTYLAFDTLQRVWLDAGFRVHYAQNVTDIDDPLLERAAATGVGWRELAAEQIALFRTDMEALGIRPPDDYVTVTEVLDDIAQAVARLQETGYAYTVETPESSAGDDIYFDNAAASTAGPWRLGEISGLDEATMLRFFGERGGDPDRAGKRGALDPLLWRAARDHEPSWPSVVGLGRPGWHIECSVIALNELGTDFTVQGGGSDLVFPHHELSAAHASALSGHPLASVYSHTGMVAYRGEKMSKSLGNLVLVSKLRADGVDPRAIRLALLSQHYRNDWEWTDDNLAAAEERLASWSGSLAPRGAPGSAETAITRLREALGRDLDTPAALAIADEAFTASVDDSDALATAINALLGIRL